MQLTDLIFATVDRIFRSPPPIQGRERMTIPSIKDISNSLQSAKVEAQCRECARLLATHLYRWEKRYPEKASVKSWSTVNLCFLGMDLSLFQQYLIQHFTLRTEDNREWLLDRSVAALIWNACIEEGSPLPAASWQVELDRKREAK